jgi:hypothetical protein
MEKSGFRSVQIITDSDPGRPKIMDPKDPGFERAGSEANCKEPGTIKELKEQNKCASVVGRTSSIIILFSNLIDK